MIQSPTGPDRSWNAAFTRRIHRSLLAVVTLTGIAASTAFTTSPASAATLTRYPWINKLTPTSVLIAWQTDIPTTGTVLYSEDLSFSESANDPSTTVNHSVSITGLTEQTLYFYKVVSGADTLTLGDDTFTTAPSGPSPFLFVAFGDIGRATPAQIALASEIESLSPAFGILTGDIIYEAGEAANFTPQYFDIYKSTIPRAV